MLEYASIRFTELCMAALRLAMINESAIIMDSSTAQNCEISAKPIRYKRIKAAKAAVQPSEQPAPKAAAKTETAANETKEAERPRTVAPAAETKETKKTTAEAKPADKEADGKKKDDKKKKGGFFGVFKKIFGKDN